jgi:hypothetical protein
VEEIRQETVRILKGSKSKSVYDWQSVSQYVLVSSPVWGSWPDSN